MGAVDVRNVLKVRGWGRQKRVVRTGRKLEGPLHFSEPQPGPGERGHGSQIADLMTGDRAAWKVTRGLANGRVTVTQLAYGLCSATLVLDIFSLSPRLVRIQKGW